MLLLCDLSPQVLYYFGAVRALFFKKGLPIILFHTSYWSVWSRSASAADGRQPPTASSWIPPIRFFSHSGQRSVTQTDRRYVPFFFSTVLSGLGVMHDATPTLRPKETQLSCGSRLECSRYKIKYHRANLVSDFYKNNTLLLSNKGPKLIIYITTNLSPHKYVKIRPVFLGLKTFFQMLY